mgnify:CR=1 FL=1
MPREKKQKGVEFRTAFYKNLGKEKNMCTEKCTLIWP